MNKEESLKKLNLRKDELKTLPTYNHNRENSEFDKWHTRTRKTIEIIFGKKSEEATSFDYITFTASFRGFNEPTIQECIQEHKSGRDKSNTLLESCIEHIEEFWENDESNKVSTAQAQQVDKSKVFIVHGHDDGLVAKVQLLLTKLSLEGIVLHEQANLGKVILEKLEHYTDVGFAIILYTPCDVGKAKNAEDLKARARQNVVFEHGYLIGRIGRGKVLFLVTDKIEIPGDIAGAVYIGKDSWEQKIALELHAAGYDIDFNKIFKK